MNGRYKYIIVDRDGMELAILVPVLVLHNQAVNKLETRIVAAGFCQFVDGHVTTEGHSTSLNIGSRPQDAEIIYCTLMMSGTTGLVRPQISPGLTDSSGARGPSSEGVRSTDAATDTGRAPAPALSLSTP